MLLQHNGVTKPPARLASMPVGHLALHQYGHEIPLKMPVGH
jgi:hypothetical protein